MNLTRRNILLAGTSSVALTGFGRRFGGGTAFTTPQTIASISLSNSTYTPNTANGVVGTVTVTMSNGNSPPPNNTPGLSITGTNSGGFHLSSTSSGASLLQNPSGTTGPGPYSDFNIVYTQTGISNSPQSISPTVQSGAQSFVSGGLSTSTFNNGTGPGVTVATINIGLSPSSPAFTGSGGGIALTGTNASDFQTVLSGSTWLLQTNSGAGTLPSNTTFSFNLNPTQSGISGSPSYPVTISSITPASFPTTFNLTNNSGSSQAAGVPMHPFGQPFRDGDMPPGSIPVYTVGGVSQPYSYGLRSYFPSGNLRFVSIMLLPTFSLAGNASVACTLSATTGSWPAASGRTITDIYNQELVLNCPALSTSDPSGDAFDMLPGGGAYVGSWLKSDANNYKVAQWMDGQAGAAWRISTNMAATQGGTADPLLKFDHYVFALGAGGSPLGFRWLGRIRMPFYASMTTANCFFFCAGPNSGSPTSGLNWQINPGGAGVQTIVPTWPFATATDVTSTVAFTGTATLSNGSGAAGNILDVVSVTSGSISNGTNQPVTGANPALEAGSYFLPYGTGGTTGTGGVGTYIIGNTPLGLITSPIAVYTPGALQSTTAEAWLTGNPPGIVPVQVTGSVPTGFSVGQVWWASINSSNPNLSLCASPVLEDGISPQSSGTFTATPVFGLAPFTSLCFATPDGKYNYFQGTGSQAADTTLRMQINQTYWQAAKIIPPMDITLTGSVFGGPITDTTWNFDWNPYTNGSLTGNFNAGGDGDFIGALGTQSCVDFYNQSELSERQTRCVGFMGGRIDYDVKDATLDTLVNVTSNTYTGLPAAGSGVGLGWSASKGNTGATGFTNPGPTGGFGNLMGALGFVDDPSHQPNFSFWAYIRTGELQFFDFQSEIAVGMLLGQPNRNPNAANGDTPYSINGCYTYECQQYRGMGWGFRNIACAALFAPWNPTTPNVADFDGTQRSKYLNDLRDIGANFPIDLWNFGQSNPAVGSVPSPIFPSYAQSAYLWTPFNYNALSGSPAYEQGPIWEQCYFGDSMLYAAMGGNAKALQWLELMGNRISYIVSTYGAYPVYAYNQAFTFDSSGTFFNLGLELITEDALYVFSQVSAIVPGPSWTPNSGGSTLAFTFLSTPGGGYVPQNGDVIIPTDINGVQRPLEMSTQVPYWIVGLSGLSFNLCASPPPATTPISITSSGGSMNMNYMPKAPGPLASGGGVPYAFAFADQVQQTAKWAAALGVTEYASIISDVNARNIGAGFGGVWYYNNSVNDGYQPIDSRYCTVVSYA